MKNYERLTYRGRPIDLHQIERTVMQLIHWGAVLQIEKTKAGRTDELNGRNVVTAGPYQTATGPREWAMFIGWERETAPHPWYTARAFVRWVGRDRAREAVREWMRKNT